MIIMRRIILTLSILTLTACVGSEVEQSVATSPDTVAGAADRSGAGPSRTGADRSGVEAPFNVIIVGTSLTAGYGVGEAEAYPALLQQRIDSAGLPYRVVNAGVSGETSAGGLRRIEWSLQQPAAVLVLELGANDGLRGLPVDAMRSNLDAIIQRARSAYPDIAVVLLGMEAPPNLGDAYTSAFRDVFTELAAQHDAALVPFLLDGVAGLTSLNIEDGIHPNEAGHRIIAGTVWQVLEPVLRRHADQPASADDS